MKDGIQFFDEDGKAAGWTRFGYLDEVSVIERLKAGFSCKPSDVSETHTPAKSQESAMFRDMTYKACRGRYNAKRQSIIDRIADGSCSASMSGIEHYSKWWDELDPSIAVDFEDLIVGLTWNGVFHQKVDVIAILRAFHPIKPQ